MVNEYIQGKDRVAVDENFPYPIKLEYDDENIYLTPLWIPDFAQYDYNLGYVYLCLEIATTETVHRQRNIRSKGDVHPGKHPCKHGKFIVPGNSNFYDETARSSFTAPMTELSLNHKYTFPINKALTSRVTSHLKHASSGYYIRVRGAYRYTYGSEEWVTGWTNGKAFSNEAKIERNDYIEEP